MKLCFFTISFSLSAFLSLYFFLFVPFCLFSLSFFAYMSPIVPSLFAKMSLHLCEMVLQCPRYYFIFLCSVFHHHWSISLHLPWLYADLIAEDKYLVFKSNKYIFIAPYLLSNILLLFPLHFHLQYTKKETCLLYRKSFWKFGSNYIQPTQKLGVKCVLLLYRVL